MRLLTTKQSGEQQKPPKFERSFESYTRAKNEGYLSKSQWAKQGKTVRADAIPGIVVRKSGISEGISPWYRVLKNLGKSHYFVATEYYEVYKQDQTNPKKKAGPKPKQATSAKQVPKPEKDVFFYIPADLNSRCDYSNYFLNLLHWGWIRWQADGNGFIPLKGEYLRKFIRKELWTELRDSLINAGVIECDWHYIKGEKSYGYRLTPRYATKAKKVLCRDQDLARKIREHQNNFMPVHKWLSSHFERLDFDLELAKATIPTLPMKDDCKITREQFELQASELARRCAAREHRNSVCRFGRFHTNLTSMSKNLRACLSVDGQQLVGVDLANSQPLIAAICAKRFYQNKDSKTRLLNKVFQEGQSVYSDRELRSLEKKVESIISNTSLHMQPSSSPSLSPSYTMSESSQVVNSVPGLRHAETAKFVDLERYQSVCEKGTLYESLMKSSEIRWKFKKKFFTYVFFGSNSCRSELKTRFYKAYPSIGKMLETIKRKDYRLSSHLMQNYESTIFIHRICGALMREHRDMPVFTIHDSILTLPEHLDAVKNIIYREFDKLGVKPTLRDESYL